MIQVAKHKRRCISQSGSLYYLANSNVERDHEMFSKGKVRFHFLNVSLELLTIYCQNIFVFFIFFINSLHTVELYFDLRIRIKFESLGSFQLGFLHNPCHTR